MLAVFQPGEIKEELMKPILKKKKLKKNRSSSEVCLGVEQTLMLV